MKIIKLPFKLEIMIGKNWISLDYVPMGTDKKDPLLLLKRLWGINIGRSNNRIDKLRSHQ